MDYAKFPDSYRYYSGAEKKKGILIQGRPYIVKFRKNSREGLRYNHVSEYLGSHIFQILGVPCQNTILGTYDGEDVVVIEDFLKQDEVFVPFNGVGDTSLEESPGNYRYSYQEIVSMIEANRKLTDISYTEKMFWDIYTIDALIGNFDRHGSNWGFIKSENRYRIAPVFDNGSCLFPALNTDEKLKRILKDDQELLKRVYTFPTSQIQDDAGHKSSYYEVIISMKYDSCNEALKRIIPRIDMGRIAKVIESVDIISDVRKTFYKEILKLRYEKILLAAYKKL